MSEENTVEIEAEETSEVNETAAAENPTAAEDTQPAEDTVQKAEEAKEDQIAALQAEIDVLNLQIAKLKNEYARAYADTENTKKRLQKDYDQMYKYRIQSFAREILPVLDSCEIALTIKEENTQDENYRKAFEMVYKELRKALENEGVTEIDALNKPFDPNVHQAMMTETVEGVEPGTVTMVLKKGYMLKDRLLRAAMVKVSE